VPGDPKVQKLQETLLALGFGIVGKPNGYAGAKTRLALREFQASARLPRTAKVKAGAPAGRWVERLEPVDSTLGAPLPPVTGELDAAGDTQRALDHWINESYRCPLVVEARAVGGADFHPCLENVWDYGDPGFLVVREAIRKKTGKKPSFEFRIADFTGAAAPATTWSAMPLVGSRDFETAWGGKPLDDSAAALVLECTPKAALAREWVDLDAEQKVTFQVIRVVSEQECIGFFDALNGYDAAIISMGPCHWTVTLKRSGKDGSTTGELAPFLAYAIGRDPTLQSKAFDPFGVSPQYAWPPGAAGQDYKGSWPATRNYTGRFAWSTAAGKKPMTQYSDLSWFRTPHWYWRFTQMAAQHPVLLTSEWDMGRLRLRDLLTAKVGGSGIYKNYKLGEIFTSPLACALILRFHIKASGFAAPLNGNVSRIIARAGVTGVPKDWGDAQEEALIDALVAHAVRKSYKVSTVKYADSEKGPTVAELLAHGRKQVKARATKDIHKDAEAIRAWPDKAVFKSRGYTLEAAAQAALSGKRSDFTKAFAALVSDTHLPPPPT
jgi:hypothetical protein